MCGGEATMVEFYGYLNLESTKTIKKGDDVKNLFYGYLNLESTKTIERGSITPRLFYGYLNLESTKTKALISTRNF